MNFDLQRTLEAKRAHRHVLADRPIGEKLRMLDALRKRAIVLRQPGVPGNPGSDGRASATHRPPSA